MPTMLSRVPTLSQVTFLVLTSQIVVSLSPEIKIVSPKRLPACAPTATLHFLRRRFAPEGNHPLPRGKKEIGGRRNCFTLQNIVRSSHFVTNPSSCPRAYWCQAFSRYGQHVHPLRRPTTWAHSTPSGRHPESAWTACPTFAGTRKRAMRELR